jgi:hypothetical protein
MRVLPDSALGTAIPRQQEPSRASAQVQSPNGFEAGLPLQRVKAVSPVGGNDAGSAAKRDRRAEDNAAAFSREAPNGPRPKFVPKGQMLNLVV